MFTCDKFSVVCQKKNDMYFSPELVRVVGIKKLVRDKKSE